MFSRLSRWWYSSKSAAPALKPTLTNEQASDTNDSLSEFNERLNTEKARIKSLMNEWMQHKRDVMGGDLPHPDKPHHEQCAIETDQKVKSFIKLFLIKIKSYFQSAKSYLDDEIRREVEGHMEPLRLHINELCAQANDQGRSDDERRDTVIHICNASIVLLNELDKLVDDVEREIEYCLKAEQDAEAAAKLGINAGLVLLSGMVGIVVPPVDFDMSENYRHFLGDEIQDKKAELICDITAEEGTLQMADGLVENYADKLRRSGGFFPHPSVADGTGAPPASPATPVLR